MNKGTCTVDGCLGESRKVGLCIAHYERKRRGQPLGEVYRRGVDRRCSLDGCDRQLRCRGYCAYHYSQWQRSVPFTVPAPVPKRCEVGGCDREMVARGLCKVHSQREARTGTTDAPATRECAVEGCGRAHNANGYCPLHYSRDRYMGDPLAQPSKRSAGEGSVGAHGYWTFGGMAGHPLAGKAGYVRRCRLVLWDAIGPGQHPCHWCGGLVRWDLSWPVDRWALVADHLDWDRLNDAAHNLVPSCGHCNKARTKPAAPGPT